MDDIIKYGKEFFEYLENLSWTELYQEISDRMAAVEATWADFYKQ